MAQLYAAQPLPTASSVNGICLTENDNVAYKPFNNQLRKEAFPHFMQQRVQFAIAQLARQQCAQPPKKLSCFDDILLQDGSSFYVHKALADVYTSRFKLNPAAIESYMTMSLRTFNPTSMTITADTASERAYLPKPFKVKNKLLLADTGYPDFDFFADVERHNGFYIVRGAKSLNPRVVEAKNGKGRVLPKLVGMKLKDITRLTNRTEALDLTVSRGKQEFRVVRLWLQKKSVFASG